MFNTHFGNISAFFQWPEIELMPSSYRNSCLPLPAGRQSCLQVLADYGQDYFEGGQIGGGG